MYIIYICIVYLEVYDTSRKVIYKRQASHTHIRQVETSAIGIKETAITEETV